MTAQPALAAVQQLTESMLDTARQEKWVELAALEDKRRALLAQVDLAVLKSPANQDLLRHIVELNQDVKQRIQNRQADIKFLLDAFDDPLEKAAG